MDIPILYEDNHLLVVEKPVNMPVQADSSGDADLLSALKAYIGEKYNKPGAVYLGLVHRLDRPVGGVMVFARTSKAAARLSEQFRAGDTQKRYIAVVEGAPPENGLYEDYMLDAAAPRVGVLPHPTDGARLARLRFHRVAAIGDTALMDITLLTGRKHQIRAQFAAHGHPIVHDQRYHPQPSRGQIVLWAYALTLSHPTTKARMTFTAAPRTEGFSAYRTQAMALPAFQSGYALYADASLLVADKQAAVEVASADAGTASLQSAMEAHFSTLYPVHRIDANTRGLVLFARTHEARDALLSLFARGELSKVYRCIVRGRPSPAEATLDAFAKKDAERGLLTVQGTAFPGASLIRTGYRVLEAHGDSSLLEVRLYTGRTHQVRAHLAHIGHPLLGDDKYGDRDWNKRRGIKRQALVAHALAFEWEGRRLSFRSTFEVGDGE